jgi:hypothetical protein
MDNFDEMETQFAGKIGRSSKCPPPEMLLAYRQSVLRDEAESAVETHLRKCRICPILLEDLVSISQQNLTSDEDRGIRSRVPALAPKTVARPWKFYTAAIAACLVLSVGIALFLRHSSPGSSAVPQGSSASRDIASIAIEKLPPPQTSEPQFVLRGDASSAEPTLAELAPGFDAYGQNDYKTSADRFGELAKQFPKSDVPVLYLGISQLLLGRHEAALQSLAQADTLAQPERKDAAGWYHAVAAAQAHAPQAVSLLRSICQNRASMYSREACSALSSSGSLQ